MHAVATIAAPGRIHGPSSLPLAKTCQCYFLTAPKHRQVPLSLFTALAVMLDGVNQTQEVQLKAATLGAPQVETRLRHAEDVLHP
jgi:hypothetical protein